MRPPLNPNDLIDFAFTQTRRSAEILPGLEAKNDMVAGTRQVYQHTWLVPSSCILRCLWKGDLRVQRKRERAVFLYRARGLAATRRARKSCRYMTSNYRDVVDAVEFKLVLLYYVKI